MTMVMTSSVTAIGTSLKLENQLLFPLNHMSYSFEFTAPSLQTATGASNGYTSLSMPGCLAVGKQAGDPAIPVKVVQLLLPPKKTVASITVVGTPITVNLGSVNLKTKPVYPQQPSLPIGSDVRPEFTINSEIYSTNSVFPATTYTDYSVGYSHGYAILALNLNPVQYNPVQGSLVYYPKLTVAISLQNAAPNQFYRNNPRDASYVKTLVSNPEIAGQYSRGDLPTFEYPGGLCNPSEKYDYVIVTTTQHGLDYWDTSETTPYNWDSLIAEHNGEGLKSTEVTVEDINACSDYYGSSPFNDSMAHVREFCKDAYEDWGAQFFLFAGDSDTIPARQMYYSYEGNVDADIYWSNLDNDFNNDHDSQWGEEGDTGFDLYAETYIGRITCDQPQDVSNWLTKSFFYADSSDGDYLDNAGFYAGQTGWDAQGDDFMDYSAIKGTDDWLGPNPDDPGEFPSWVGFQYGFETWNIVHEGNQYNISVRCTEEPPNPGWSGSGVSGFRDAINNDLVTIISGIAHANNQMSLDVDASTWANSYHNTRPFFIHDYGCHCGDFNDGDDGVLETMLFHSDTELAFGCVYNTGYGWGQFESTNSSSAFQAKEFWSYFLDMENSSQSFGNWQFGVGHAYSKDQMAPMINWDYSYGTWRGIIECCLLFADPAQMLKTPHPSQSPSQPTKPVGPTLGIWHQEYTYTSTSSDPENDNIYFLFDWGDGSNSGWIGPYNSGDTGVGHHTWDVLGTYAVRVKARDVWGAGSKWSDSLMVTITDNTPPDAPVITGPAEGTPGVSYLYNIVTTDPQGQEIRYWIDWGDNTSSGWLGPYVSGTEIHVNHAWSAEGDYTIRAKAKDIMDMEGEWGNFTVAMPFDFGVGMTQQQQSQQSSLLYQLLNR
jgi:hypothetical protein